MPALNVGDAAPPFELSADDDSTLSLAALAGDWAVVYFYPRDNTPGCTTESCAFRDNYAAFRSLDAQILGVSADSLASHVRFKTKYDLPFKLLSDPDKTMLQAWGVWAEKKNYGRTYMGIVRSTYIVDPAGKIAAAWPKVRVKGHVEAVLAELTALRAE